jgi:hypothetical protein
MNEIRDLEAKLRSLTDREMLEILGQPHPSESRQLSLAIMEADRRGGVAALRARVEPIRPLILKCIGYWKEDNVKYRDCPEPDWLTQPGWGKEDLKATVAYLGMGQTCAAWCGYARCWFPQCVEGDRLGSKDLTDGEWVWPEGLAHYIERHSVILPEEFRAKMRQCGWAVSPPDRELALQLRYKAFDFDRTFWIDWSRKVRCTQRAVG